MQVKNFFFTFNGDPDFEEVDEKINEWLNDLGEIEIKSINLKFIPETAAVYLLIMIFYVES